MSGGNRLGLSAYVGHLGSWIHRYPDCYLTPEFVSENFHVKGNSREFTRWDCAWLMAQLVHRGDLHRVSEGVYALEART